MPLGFNCFTDAIRCGCEVFHNLKKVLHGKKLSTNVGDEGGFAPDLKTFEEALDVIVEAIGKAGYEPGKQAFIARNRPPRSSTTPRPSGIPSTARKSIPPCSGGNLCQMGR